MILIKVLEIIFSLRSIYFKKKVRRDLNCVGYKYKGLKVGVSYLIFYSGINIYISVKN